MGGLRKKWNFNTFFINQQNEKLMDRSAVGAEARYFDPIKAFFALFDYDIFFKALDIFLFNGHWTLPTKTTLNLILDYRAAKYGDGKRNSVRPTMRLDYSFTKWMHFEAEGGFEWVDEKSSDLIYKSAESFISVGYRINF